jgi:hypothetical protein
MNLRIGFFSLVFVLVLAVSVLCAATPQSAEPPKPSNSAPPPCNVTIPNGSQPTVNDFGGSASPGHKYPGSHGNGKLWTILPVDGKVEIVPDQQGKLSEKWIWYRAVHGHLSISGRRFDGPGNFQTGPLEEIVVGRDTGLLVNGLVFPSEGCWQVEASAGDAQLAFVVEVHAKR